MIGARRTIRNSRDSRICHRHHRGKSFSSITSRVDVEESGRPFATRRKNLGTACVRAGEIKWSVRVLRHRSCQLRVGDRGIPVTAAKVRIAQIRHARSGIGRGKTGTKTCGRQPEVRNRSRQIIDVHLQHAAHDERVSLANLTSRHRQKIEHTQSLEATSGRRQRVRLRRARH